MAGAAALRRGSRGQDARGRHGDRRQSPRARVSPAASISPGASCTASLTAGRTGWRAAASWWSAPATRPARSPSSWHVRAPTSRWPFDRAPRSCLASCSGFRSSTCRCSSARCRVSFVQRVTTMIGGLRGPRVLPPPPATDCPKVPLIGLALADALRGGVDQARGGLTAFTPEGVRFHDGSEQAYDDVILATGYRAALGFLEGVVGVDGCGFGRRRDRVVSLDHPDSVLRRPQLRCPRWSLQHRARRTACGAGGRKSIERDRTMSSARGRR